MRLPVSPARRRSVVTFARSGAKFQGGEITQWFEGVVAGIFLASGADDWSDRAIEAVGVAGVEAFLARAGGKAVPQ